MDKSTIDIDLCITYEPWKQLINKEGISIIINEVFSFLKINVKKKLFISITLMNDNEIKKINLEYRNNDKATDVLSFTHFDIDNLPNYPIIYIGDIFLSYEHMFLNQKNPIIYIIKMLIHATLHILGFEHDNDANADIMEKYENSILRRLNARFPNIQK